ncbi:MAG: FtsQ-type POTRA domain-containing protein [bacterium]
MLRNQILEESKKKKRKKIWTKFFLAIVLLVFLAGGIIYSLYLDYFRIKNINIEGNYILNKQEIEENIKNSISGKLFYVLPKNNILIISTEEINNNLAENFLRIKNLEVAKNFPDSLDIKISERKTYGLFCKENGCFFLDKNGYVFSKSIFVSGDIFIKFLDERENNNITFKTYLLDINEFAQIRDFIDGLKTESVMISQVVFKKDGLFEFQTEEGWYILLSERSDYKLSLDNLKIALINQIKEKRPELEYIDLRLENKVFYKFKD